MFLTAFNREKTASTAFIGKVAALATFNRKYIGVYGVYPKNWNFNGIYSEK